MVDRNDADNKNTQSNEDVIFKYKGIAYNRPLGRGILILDGEKKDLYLDEVMPEDYCEIEITIRKLQIDRSKADELFFGLEKKAE